MRVYDEIEMVDIAKEKIRVRRLMNQMTPKGIKDWLDSRVYGQADAKKRVAVEVYKHLTRINAETLLEAEDNTLTKSNIMLTGLTGTGKTFLMEQVAELLSIPIYIYDCTTLTEAGYVGEDVENCLLGLIKNADYDIERAEKGIIVLDEIDKLGRKSENPSITRDVSGEGVQQALLKILEGTIASVPAQGGRKHPQQEGIKINTKNILFIGCGSFEGIEQIVKKRIKGCKSGIGFDSATSRKKDISNNEARLKVNREDLRIFGMMPELVGRFSILANLHPLEKEDLIEILKLKKNVFKNYYTMFGLLGKELVIKEDFYEWLADKSMKEGTGARALTSVVEDIMVDIMFNMPSEDEDRYIIDYDFINKYIK